MMTKIFLLALFAVAIAQEEYAGPEYEIKKALMRLKGMSTGAERGVTGALREVAAKRAGVQSRATDFLQRERSLESQLQRTVERVAGEMVRRAEELNKPKGVFECIDKASKLTSSRIEAVGPKFETDIRRLERTKVDNIDTAAKPLQGIKDGLELKLEKFSSEVKNCKDSICVRKTVERARREYDLLNAEFRRILSQVLTAYSQFSRDAATQFSNLSRLANRIATEGIRSIKSCVFGRSFDDLFENEEIEY